MISARLLAVPLLIPSLLACAPAPGTGPTHEAAPRVAALDLPPSVLDASALIESGVLRDTVSEIASDAYEGRGPGTDGDRRARNYLVQQLKELGFEPGMPGGAWEQPFSIVGLGSKMPETWVFRGGDGDEGFAFRDEYMAATGVQQESVAITDAELVFVGYGIVAPEEDWDDFKDVDLRGKILLMLNDDPDWDDELFAGERKLSYGRWTYKYESAARQGAAGAIILHTTPSAGYPWSVVQSSWSGEQFEVPAGSEPRVKIQAWLTEDAARRMVALGGQDLDQLIASARSREFRPLPLGVKTSIAFPVEIRKTETANVGGFLPGSERPDEFMVYSAHHDHLGIGEPDETGDRIYNGALDNGVAISQEVAVARAFASLPQRPRRSVLFYFPAAEEQGLLGSHYFATHPPVHPSKMVAGINFELGNVWGRTRDIVIYGRGKSTLEDLIAAGAARQDRLVTAETDLRAGWYYRSDQISLAKAGVPAVWFKSGTDFLDKEPGWGEKNAQAWISNHYHQPSDEVLESWDYSGLAEDAQIAFWAGWSVANGEHTPTWYPGDEFEAVRSASLEDAKSKPGS